MTLSPITQKEIHKLSKEEMQSKDVLLWKEIIDNEMNSSIQNHTWELVDVPEGAKPISCKWIFKRKLWPDGTIEKYKTRLVANSLSKKEGIDFYAPVYRITTIRVLIAWASIRKFIIHQMDVKSAFLNGNLTKEIYMERSEGLETPIDVCNLAKSL